MTESFNSWIDNYRSRSILAFCEGYRRKVMKRLRHRHEKAKKWQTEFPPQVHRRLEKATTRGRSYEAIWCGDDKYEVITPQRTYIVQLDSMTCDCGLWQLSGIPCSHVMPCLNMRRVPIKQYVDESLTKERYMLTYEGMIQPVPDESSWIEVECSKLDPPIVRRPPGRPRIARKREHWEKATRSKGGSSICGQCRQVGHNKRTCPHWKKSKTTQPSQQQGAALVEQHPTSPHQGPLPDQQGAVPTYAYDFNTYGSQPRPS